MGSFHALLLDTVGNNLVNADFSPYSRMFFAVKHIYLTLYIVYMCRISPIYSVHLYLLALLAVRAARSAVHVLRPDRFQPLAVRAARSARCPVLLAALACPRLCVRLLMPGQRWTFLSVVPVRSRARARPCALPCLPAPVPVCSRACLLPCLPAPTPVPVLATLAPCAWPACSRCSRLYCSFSRRALARCSTLSARRKLFRDRLRGVDIYPAVVRGGGWHDFILLYGSIWGRGDSVAISWYAVGLKKSFARGLTNVTRCAKMSLSQGQGSKGRTQARQARPTSNSKASRTDRRAYASHRPDARKQVHRNLTSA